MTKPLNRLTREELYARVWQTPLSRLAPEYGISGNGLAKHCDKLDIPYPPRGHWAKIQAGKTVRPVPLPPEPRPREPRRAPPPSTSPVLRSRVQHPDAAPLIQATLEGLHSKVRARLAEHTAEQRKRHERRRGERDPFMLAFLPQPLPELTERDRYRLQVTSVLLGALEKEGIKVTSAAMTDRLTLAIGGETIECVLVGKMRKAIGQKNVGWTAYPQHHNPRSALRGSSASPL